MDEHSLTEKYIAEKTGVKTLSYRDIQNREIGGGVGGGGKGRSVRILGDARFRGTDSAVNGHSVTETFRNRTKRAEEGFA